MARLLYTVDNMTDEIRSQLDEENTDSINTARDILPALNRAQDFAFDILTRKYPEPLLSPPQTLAMVSGQAEYDIPENVFEDRIEKLEVMIPSGSNRPTYQALERISYRDIGQYESSTLTNIPFYYAIYARKIRIVPAPTGTYNLNMWYLREPEKLVVPQGRITILNTSSNYVILDGIGSSLTTESDQLGSYVNFIDGQTGEIKGSAQVQILGADRVTFRASPLRSTVLGRTITGDISTLSIEQDDYLAPIDGTCVPYYSKPLANFMIRYAVNELRDKLEDLGDLEVKLIDDLKQQVERTWAGREQQLRIKKKSRIWGRPTRRWYWE